MITGRNSLKCIYTSFYSSLTQALTLPATEKFSLRNPCRWVTNLLKTENSSSEQRRPRSTQQYRNLNLNSNTRTENSNLHRFNRNEHHTDARARVPVAGFESMHDPMYDMCKQITISQHIENEPTNERNKWLDQKSKNIFFYIHQSFTHTHRAERSTYDRYARRRRRFGDRHIIYYY